MDWVWTQAQAKGVGRLILLALADKARTTIGDCKAYGSYRFLAQRANCTNGAVTKALAALYESGELELLDETGPNGAAAYRLPKAVGYVRDTRANRTTQSCDPGASDGSESHDSVVRPAHDSVVRSESESHYSADHYTNQPPPTTPPPQDPRASPTDADGREGGGDASLRDTPAFQALARITTRHPQLAIGEKELHDLAPLAAQWLERTTADRLEQALTAGLPREIGSPAGLLRKRLIDKLPPIPVADTGEPRCTDPRCDPVTHMLTLPSGDIDFCPTCHPTGRARARRRQQGLTP